MNLWVTGYQSYELGVFNSKDKKVEVIKYALQKKILEKIDEGLEWVITGAQMGIEQWTCEVVAEMKKEYPELKLAIMMPYSEFAGNWNEANQESFSIRCSLADFVGEVSKEKYKSPMQLKNYQNFMLDHTDQAMLIYDPEHEGKTKYDYEMIKKYSEQEDYPYDLVDMYQLQEFAEMYQKKDSF